MARDTVAKTVIFTVRGGQNGEFRQNHCLGVRQNALFSKTAER